MSGSHGLFPQNKLTHFVGQGALLLASTLVAARVPAQSLDYGALEALFNEPVTTSVTGGPQRASTVPASMVIVTAEQIRRSGALNVPDVLKQVTGVDVLQWSATHADVAVRGYNKAFSSRLLVLVNGREIYADHYGYTPWAALPVELAEIRQIEVVKGPNSALFGFNAVGGVINIITFAPSSDDVSYISGTAGSQDHLQLSAARTLRLGDKAALRVSAGGRESDDFDTPQRLIDNGVRQGDERNSLAFDLHYQLRPNVELDVEGSRVMASQTSMSPVYSMLYEDMETRSLSARLGVDSQYGLTEARLYRNWIDDRVFLPYLTDQSSGQPASPLASFDNQVTVAKFQQLIKPAAAHTVRVGAEYRESQLPVVPLAQAIVSYDVVAYSAMWEWQYSPTLAFTLAAREDHLRLDREGSIPARLGLANADWQRSINAFSFNASVVWRPGANDVLRYTAARGSQLPNLYNLGGALLEFPAAEPFQPPATAFLAGLPFLEPTTVSSHEWSWERQLQSLPLRLIVSAFHGNNSRLIADSGGADIAAGIFTAPVNIGDSSTSGVELTLAGDLAAGWNWQLGYIHQDIDDRLLYQQYPIWSSQMDYENTTARHAVTARLQRTQGPWEADLYARYKSHFVGLHAPDIVEFGPPDFYAGSEVLVPLPAYTAVDLHVGYRVSEQLRVDVAGQNLLTDEQTQTSGPRVERRLFATLRYNF